LTKAEAARLIDSTLLKADASQQDILKLCEDAKRYEFFSVCVNPCWVTLAVKLLKQADVKVSTVIGFPLGANTIETKMSEAKQAIAEGADELDLVLNVGAIKSKKFGVVFEEMKAFRKIGKNLILKVILETTFLTDPEKIKTALLAEKTGIDFVKTSTGFSSNGATIRDVRLLRKTLGSEVKIKASGGIRSADDFLAFVKAGAARIGTSSAKQILNKLGTHH